VEDVIQLVRSITIRGWLVAVVLLCSTPTVGRAEDQAYSLSAVNAYGALYAPDVWMPVRLELRNATSRDQDGYVLIPLSGKRAMTVRVRVYVPAHSRVSASAYAVYPEANPDAAPAPAGKAEPLTVTAWYSDQQARLDRCEVLGRPVGSLPNSPSGGDTSAGRLGLMVDSQTDPEGRISYESFDFAKSAGVLYVEPTNPASVMQEAVPRLRAGYDSALFLVLNSTSLDDLDTSQRKALLDFLTTGGTVILPSPVSPVDLQASWFAPYFPVDVIGRRHAKSLSGTFAGTTVDLPLREPIDLTEALPGKGHIIYSNDNYVHAAYRDVGMGRVVFTSFPINALNFDDEKTQALWQALLINPSGPLRWEQTALGDMVVKPDDAFHQTISDDAGPTVPAQRPMILDSLVGQPTVAWKTALAVVGIYVVSVVLIQLLISATHRPTAFAWTTVGAIAGAGMLVAVASFKQSREELIVARFATLDMATDRGGTQREVLTFLGKDDPNLSLTARRTDVTVRPLIVNRSDTPTLQLNPFAIPHAASFAGRMDRAWLADAVIPADSGAFAFGQFGQDGLRIRINNRFASPLQGPLLVWGPDSFSLNDAPAGESTVNLSTASRNVAGSFTNVVNFASDIARLRGQIVEASMTRSRAAGPSNTTVNSGGLLIGWLGSATPSILEIKSEHVPLDRTQAMVRIPLQIERSEAGARVRIDAPFVRLVSEESRGLPFDAQAGKWLDRSQADGDWLVCFELPPAAGKINAERIRLYANLDAPQYTFTFRRMQVEVARTTHMPNLDAPVVAQWRGPLGDQSAEFKCDASDVDARGRIWMALSVKRTNPTQDTMLPVWRVRSLEIGVDGLAE